MITDVPALEIAHGIQPVKEFDPAAVHNFYYEVTGHDELPHVVKFSGGRSSGMLLFVLLEAGLLKAERGDVVVFNNTSAEHPETYNFVRQCKQLVETRYSIPFFWVEFQTYEDARNGEYIRLPSYRLVKSEPWSETTPDGYHWRGEVYEELLSWTGFVPNVFQRTCTKNLKLESTRAFLKEWFANKPETERLGHFGNGSRLEDDDIYARHLRNRGSVPRSILLEKKKFVRERPVYRPSQSYTDFSVAVQTFQNPCLHGKTLGTSTFFGKDGVEYLAFVGLRYDEMRRVIKVRRRNSGGLESAGYEGEHVYMPFSEMGVTKEDVDGFWKKQSWDLELNAEDGLSNCTYCFLKGTQGLQKVHSILGVSLDEELKNTPCDLSWWGGIERKYGRDLKAEQRQTQRDIPNNFIGFFGIENNFSYQLLAESESKKDLSKFTDNILPCDCTD